MREWQGSDFVEFQLESYFSCVAFVVLLHFSRTIEFFPV